MCVCVASLSLAVDRTNVSTIADDDTLSLQSHFYILCWKLTKDMQREKNHSGKH